MRLDGLTAAVAAERLGLPKGTVDTRLATAKRRLADRLARRGLVAGSLALVTVAPVSAEFADRIAQAACAYALAGATAAPTPVSLLADGVRPAMSSTARLFALGMVVAAVTGTAGTALYNGHTADDKPQAQKPPAKPAAKPTPPPYDNAPNAEPPSNPRLATEPELRRMLAVPSGVTEPQNITFGVLLAELENRGMDTRIDLPALLRAEFPQEELTALRDKQLMSFGGKGTTWGDLLADSTAGITWGGAENGPGGRLTYWVSGYRLVVGPAYRTPSLPGGANGPDHQLFLSNEQVMEQLVGPPVSVAVEGRPLTEAVKQLRALTGANIVIDQRAKDKITAPVAGTFDDVRLLTVLQVLADQAGLKPVTLNNVYYLTDPINAVELQRQADADLHGPPQSQLMQGAGPSVTIPAGFVTDGYQYFPRTADMKPVDPRTIGAFGGQGGGGVQPLPGMKPVPAEKK